MNRLSSYWAALDDVEKFTLYLRWSTYLGLVVFLTMSLLPVLQVILTDGWPPYSLACLFVLAANAVVAIGVVRCIPELSTQPRSTTMWAKVIRIEIVCLVLPFVLVGCLCGVVFAAATAQVSSLDATDAITYHSLIIFLIYLIAIPLFTEFQLRMIGTKRRLTPIGLYKLSVYHP